MRIEKKYFLLKNIKQKEERKLFPENQQKMHHQTIEVEQLQQKTTLKYN